MSQWESQRASQSVVFLDGFCCTILPGFLPCLRNGLWPESVRQINPSFTISPLIRAFDHNRMEPEHHLTPSSPPWLCSRVSSVGSPFATGVNIATFPRLPCFYTALITIWHILYFHVFIHHPPPPRHKLHEDGHFICMSTYLSVCLSFFTIIVPECKWLSTHSNHYVSICEPVNDWHYLLPMRHLGISSRRRSRLCSALKLPGGSGDYTHQRGMTARKRREVFWGVIIVPS